MCLITIPYKNALSIQFLSILTPRKLLNVNEHYIFRNLNTSCIILGHILVLSIKWPNSCDFWPAAICLARILRYEICLAMQLMTRLSNIRKQADKQIRRVKRYFRYLQILLLLLSLSFIVCRYHSCLSVCIIHVCRYHPCLSVSSSVTFPFDHAAKKHIFDENEPCLRYGLKFVHKSIKGLSIRRLNEVQRP